MLLGKCDGRDSISCQQENVTKATVVSVSRGKFDGRDGR